MGAVQSTERGATVFTGSFRCQWSAKPGITAACRSTSRTAGFRPGAFGAYKGAEISKVGSTSRASCWVRKTSPEVDGGAACRSSAQHDRRQAS